MKTKIWLLLLIFANAYALDVFALSADILSPAADKVDVTIYRDDEANSSSDLIPLSDPEAADRGLLMVNEIRTLDLPQGDSRILFHGVADAIIPQTAKLQNVGADILESNFDYNLISPYELFNKSVGESVTLVRRDAITGARIELPAIIRSSAQKILLEVDGTFEEFNCANKTQEILFHKVPEQLTAEPSLSVTVRAPRAGRFKVQLSYLAVGAQWSADYVARINNDGKTADLSAWITLVNARATTFANAPLQVVAGKVEYDSSETAPPKVVKERDAGTCWPAIKVPSYGGYYDSYSSEGDAEEIIVTGIKASLSELGDYKLYSVPGNTALSARQSKQVLMIDQKAVPFERINTYKLDVYEVWDKVDSRSFKIEDEEEEVYSTFTKLRFLNTAKKNLGVPLPSGNFSVMEEQNGHSIFVGQTSIRDQSVGLPFDIDLGSNSDVIVIPKIISANVNRDEDSAKVKMDVLIKNYNEVESLAEVQLVTPDRLSIKIRSESAKHSIDKGHLCWLIKLGPGEIKHLEYELFIKEKNY